MNTKTITDSLETSRWQHMLAILSERDPLFSSHFHSDTKLVISRRFTENAFVLLLQYMGIMFSTLTPHPAPLYFAAGTGCAFLFLRGVSILPGILTGSLLAYVLAGIAFMTAMNLAVIDVLQAGILYWIACRYIQPTLVFYQLKRYLLWLACLMFITACMSLARITVIHHMTMHAWLQNNLCNMNGVLIVGTSIMTFNFYFAECIAIRLRHQMKWLGFTCCLAVLVILLLFSPQHSLLFAGCLSLLCMMFIIIAADWTAISAALFLLGLLLNLGAFMDAPLFLSHETDNMLPILAAGLTIISIAGFTIAILRQDSHRD